MSTVSFSLVRTIPDFTHFHDFIKLVISGENLLKKIPNMKILIIQFIHPARNSPFSLSSRRSLHFALKFAQLVFFC
jgi:hypothetical protein